MNKGLTQAAMLAAAMGLATSASAAQFYVNSGTNFDPGDIPNDVGVNGSNLNTGALDELSFTYTSTSVITDTNNSGFIDAGDRIVSTLNTLNAHSLVDQEIGPAGPDGNDFPNSWFLDFQFNDVEGEFNALGGIDFSMGTISAFYADSANGPFTPFRMFDMILTSGSILPAEQVFNGHLANYNIVDILASGVAVDDIFNFVMPDTSFGDQLVLWDISQTLDSNDPADDILNLFGEAIAVGGTRSITARHDGSLEFVIPEPAPLALIGLGLLGLGLSRRARKTA